MKLQCATSSIGWSFWSVYLSFKDFFCPVNWSFLSSICLIDRNRNVWFVYLYEFFILVCSFSAARFLSCMKLQFCHPKILTFLNVDVLYVRLAYLYGKRGPDTKNIGNLISCWKNLSEVLLKSFLGMFRKLIVQFFWTFVPNVDFRTNRMVHHDMNRTIVRIHKCWKFLEYCITTNIMLKQSFRAFFLYQVVSFSKSYFMMSAKLLNWKSYMSEILKIF